LRCISLEKVSRPRSWITLYFWFPADVFRLCSCPLRWKNQFPL